ncbi:hypothetical protein SPONN_1592 [uncultured Candidatus Thioglobus sp.]|nr:hypothetical protein SPONN_1592 [uncultured Candidatus Thioglobus sp.]
MPAEKLQRFQALIQLWFTEKAHTRKHVASIVCPGCTFLRQLFSLAPHQYVGRKQTWWWRCFLQTWSGSSFFPPFQPSFHVYSEASGGYGYGAFVEGLGWFQGQWPGGWEDVDISVKELVPVVMAAGLGQSLGQQAYLFLLRQHPSSLVGLRKRGFYRFFAQNHVFAVFFRIDASLTLKICHSNSHRRPHHFSASHGHTPFYAHINRLYDDFFPYKELC